MADGGVISGYVIQAIVTAAVSYGVSALLTPSPPDLHGPRAGDNDFQSSTYGKPVTLLYGTTRLAGNVIWSTDPIEAAKSETIGGGPSGGGQTSTTYSYTKKFAVGLCEGEIGGIGQVWFDKKRVADFRAASDMDPLVPLEHGIRNIEVYTGTEDQLPDPTMEAELGVGNVPAYRGLAYVVIELDITQYGNRLPNIEFEVARVGETTSIIPSIDLPTYTLEGFVREPKNFEVNSTSAYALYRYPIDAVGDVTAGAPDTWKFILVRYDLSTMSEQEVFEFVSTDVGAVTDTTLSDVTLAVDPEHLTLTVKTGNFSDHKVQTLPLKDIFINPSFQFGPSGVPAQKIRAIANQFYSFGFSTMDVYNISGSSLVLDTSTSLVTQLGGSQASGEFYLFFESFIDVKIALRKSVGNAFIIMDDAYNVEEDFAVEANVEGFSFADTYGMVNNNTSITVGNGQQLLTPVIIPTGDIADFVVTDVGEMKVVDALRELALKSGVGEESLDFSLMDDTIIDGYAVSRKTPVRGAVLPILETYSLDVIESDWILQFKPQSQDVVAQIFAEDLAMHEYGADSPAKLEKRRIQNVELPRKVEVIYRNRDGAYLAGAQYSSRIQSLSEEEIQMSLPLVMSDSQAAQLADTSLKRIWIRRTLYTAYTPIVNILLDGADVIEIEDENQIFRKVRVITSELAMPGIVKLSCVSEGDDFNSLRLGADGGYFEQDVLLIGSTVLLLLDIPILRDEDDDLSFYSASYGVGKGWKGSQLFKSIDGGSIFSEVSTMTAPIISGSATNALGNAAPNVYDYGSSVNVFLANEATLASVTKGEALNFSNTALIGADARWEVISFASAVLEIDGSYTLSGLVRGRKGTERFIDTHEINDSFLLMEEAPVSRPPAASTDLNIERVYRGVSIGKSLDSATDQIFNNTGLGATPYAPCQLDGYIDVATDNWELSWERRSRYVAELVDNVDVPLGETSEKYEIEILDGVNVVRTVALSDIKNYVYSSADQVADFGSNQSSITFRVYQISETIGRGLPTEETV